MPCTPNCGSCCDPVGLDDDQAHRIFAFGPAQPQAQWIAAHWMPLGRNERDDGVLFKCINYDVEARACLAYDSRPPVCSQFPFYGREPSDAAVVGRHCGYQAELGRTVLPLVEVR